MYRISAQSADTVMLESSAILVQTSQPAEAILLQNIPNPFNNVTKIRFGLTTPGLVSMMIFDIQGRHVRNLLDQAPFGSGYHLFEWDGLDERGRSLSSGVYVVVMGVAGITKTRKIMLLQ
jgi:hypothetical protein